MQKISVLILTHNSDQTLVRCLESVKGFDEIVVIDSGSTDMTESIVHSYMGRFISNRFTTFSEQRNFALSKATHDWCLFIDSDECLTKGLAEKLYELIAQKETKVLYRIVRTEYVLGKETKTGHGKSWYQERFFNKTRVRYTGEIHEHPLIDGKKAHEVPHLVEDLPFDLRIDHYPDNTITSAVKKIATYSVLKAQEKIRDGRKTNFFVVYFTFHLTFWQMFFKSFREGKRGFMVALVEALHRTVVKLLIYENQVIKEELKD